MSNIKKNGFAKWSSVDEEGIFTYRGKVTKLSPTRIELTTMDGVLNLDVDDGTFTAIKKPANWKKPSTLNFVACRMQSPAKNVKRNSHTLSKKDLAIKMYADVSAEIGQTPTRGEMISKFVKELGMTTAGASTYVAMAKKANQ